jgi:hypothetical protein
MAYSYLVFLLAEFLKSVGFIGLPNKKNEMSDIDGLLVGPNVRLKKSMVLEYFRILTFRFHPATILTNTSISKQIWRLQIDVCR